MVENIYQNLIAEGNVMKEQKSILQGCHRSIYFINCEKSNNSREYTFLLMKKRRKKKKIKLQVSTREKLIFK